MFGKADGMSFSSRVDLDFFDVFALPTVAGRALDFADRGAQTVAVNESLAKNLGGNPVGMRVRYAAARGDGGVIKGEPGPWLEVVGVVTNAGGDTDVEMIYQAARPVGIESRLLRGAPARRPRQSRRAHPHDRARRRPCAARVPRPSPRRGGLAPRPGGDHGLHGARILSAGTVNLSSLVLPMTGISTLMTLVGIAACAVPARRALSVQPTEAIRDVG